MPGFFFNAGVFFRQSTAFDLGALAKRVDRLIDIASMPANKPRQDYGGGKPPAHTYFVKRNEACHLDCASPRVPHDAHIR
jgi:hypothetical protein